jgi:phage terminase large subunit
MGLSDHFEVQETKILGKNGSEFSFAGIRQQGINNLKSFEGVDVCWVEEAQVVSKKSWDVLIPTIRKPGSEIWITFNPELEDDETYQRFVVNPPPDSWVETVNWSDNPWFPDVLNQERMHMQARDPVGYRTIWEGKCRPAVEGAIYSEELAILAESKRVQNLPYDPALKVHAVFDLGWNDSTSIILVQRSSSEVRIIGYIEGDHRTLADYSQDMKSRRYDYGDVWLPHDARHKNLMTGKSPQEFMQALGWSVKITPMLDIEAGIHAARMLFPRCYFDKESTGELIASLKRYKRQLNQTTGSFGAPLHDDSSHAADAFRYLAVIADQITNEDWGGKLNYPKLSTV